MRLKDLSATGRAVAVTAFLLGIMLVLFLLAEAAVRVRAFLKYGYSDGVESQLVIDPASGLRIPRPGSRQGPIVINSMGFRGPDIQSPKPPGTIRIGYLGGSTTYCAEVSGNERVWADIVTRRLRERFPGVEFDYVNAGAPGYGLRHLRTALQKRVSPLEPDVLVIYEATNDLSGNSFNLAVEQGVVEKRPDQQRLWLSEYSLLVRLVELNLVILSRQDSAQETVGKLAVDLERLVDPFRTELEGLLDEARGAAPIVAVATFSTQYRREQSPDQQVKAADSSLFYMPYMSIQGLLDGFDAYNQAIREAAGRAGVILIGDEDSIPGDSLHFHDSVHFTDAGSEAMAERVYSALEKSPLLQSLVEQRRQAVTGDAGRP
jgi:lysophospholipase L1-like esterase